MECPEAALGAPPLLLMGAAVAASPGCRGGVPAARRCSQAVMPTLESPPASPLELPLPLLPWVLEPPANDEASQSEAEQVVSLPVLLLPLPPPSAATRASSSSRRCRMAGKEGRLDGSSAQHCSMRARRKGGHEGGRGRRWRWQPTAKMICRGGGRRRRGRMRGSEGGCGCEHEQQNTHRPRRQLWAAGDSLKPAPRLQVPAQLAPGHAPREHFPAENGERVGVHLRREGGDEWLRWSE